MRNSIYEQALVRLGVEYEYLDSVPLEQINYTRGKQMQARLSPLDLTLVDEYRGMLLDGSEPPPLILHRPGRGLYVPLDGNQRVEAKRTAPKKFQGPFDAYVVKTDDQMVVERVCWQFNNFVNGRRLSYEECMAHAVTFCRKYGQPQTQTAKDWGVKAHELSAKVKELDLRELAAKHRVDLSNVKNDTVFLLSPLQTIGEDLFLDAARTVRDTGASADDVRELLKDVKAAKTVENRKRLVSEFKDTPKLKQRKAETKGGRVTVGALPRQQLQKLIARLEALLDEYEVDAFRPLKQDRDRAAGAAMTVCNELIQVYGLGSLLKGQGVA